MGVVSANFNLLNMSCTTIVGVQDVDMPRPQTGEFQVLLIISSSDEGLLEKIKKKP